MAFKGPTYGLSAEVKAKIAHKYSVECEQRVREWIEGHLGITITEQDFPLGGTGMHHFLKDGTVLRRLINKFSPGAIPEPKKKYHGEFVKTKEREMIEIVMREAGKLGVKNQSMFDVNDLYEQRNMTQVLEFIIALGGAVQKLPNYSGPLLGPKPADENKRNFTEEEIKHARDSHISTMAGSYKGESQQAFGMPRQVIS